MVETFVGTPVGTFPGVWGAAQAAALAIKKAGGPNLKILTCNSSYTPNGALACVRSAIQHKVTAYMGNAAFVTETMPVLAKAGIPAIAWGDSPAITQSLPNYPVGGSDWPAFLAESNAAKASGAKTVATLALSLPVAEAAAGLATQHAAQLGMKVVKNVTVPPTQATWNSAIADLRSANPDAVVLEVAAPQQAAIIQTAQSEGFTPAWILSGTYDAAGLKQVAALSKNLWLSSGLPPASDTKVPAIALYNQQMDAAETAGVSNVSAQDRSPQVVEWSWFSVQDLAQLLQQMKGPVTASTLLAKLHSTTKPISVLGVASWAPGANGPAPWLRVTDGGAGYYGMVSSAGVYTPTGHVLTLGSK